MIRKVLPQDVLPQLGEGLFLTDSGIETDLIEHGGFDLPEFAAFVLLDDERGREALRTYFRRHADVAAEFGCGLILETPTWRASADWGARTGYSPAGLRQVNEAAVDLVAGVRAEYAGTPAGPIVISGCVGPRADGYDPAASMTAAEAEHYHDPQIETLAAAGVALVHAMTIASVAEAVGIARAAAARGVPVAISFTTGLDGLVPDGASLAGAIAAVDAATENGPVYYGVNCTHPAYFGSALPEAPLADRLRSVRANASAGTDEDSAADAAAGAEPGPAGSDADGSGVTGSGVTGSGVTGSGVTGADADPDETAALAGEYLRLRERHPGFRILGGCCGTDARHVRAIAAACLPAGR
ncbi:MAG: homocysteine S-methyltransferase family protein [Actinomycetota bacterium]|nr:homocysteine S-methyltransferase family protein [Actinomycetota bacterium]